MGEYNDYTVYCHTSPSGKRYIGITRQNPPQKRWASSGRYSNNQYMTRAIEKYGWKNFKHEILFTGLSEHEAKEKEIELIAYYRTTDRDHGYNISVGGDPCNRGYSEEDRKKKKKEYAQKYFENEEHIQHRRQYNRAYESRRTYKDKKNEYNKTDARRAHRTEYMRRYRDEHRQRIREINQKSYRNRRCADGNYG